MAPFRSGFYAVPMRIVLVSWLGLLAVVVGLSLKVQSVLRSQAVTGFLGDTSYP
jgi:hypothetical protein